MASVPQHEYFSDKKLFHGFVPLVMGTKLDALWFGLERAESVQLWEALCAEAFRLDAMLNRFDPSSELSRLNAASDAGPVRPGDGLLSLIRVCEDWRVRTGGLFDITRGTCGEGLQFEPDGSFSLNGGSLDFGGFAKGWFLRFCKERLLEAGIRTAYVDFGGSTILGLGHHPYGASWRIRVTHPYTGALLEDVDLVDRALSTSGNRPGYNGHVVDPRTGQTVTAPRLVTVVSEDPLEAEVLSTAAMVAGEEELAALRARFQSVVKVFS
jgi:thiamine biosynthesis lipoprotein